MIKRVLSGFLAIVIIVCLTSCTQADKEKLCENIWKSSVGYLEFTDDGKVLHNFESEEESVSYYKIVEKGKINMYTEEGEQFGIVIDYKFSDGKFFLGNVEYVPFENSSIKDEIEDIIEDEIEDKNEPEDIELS